VPFSSTLLEEPKTSKEKLGRDNQGRRTLSAGTPEEPDDATF